MKKMWAAVLMTACVCLGVQASNWEIFSLSFTDEVPSDAATTPVCGVKAGAPMCGGTAIVQGVEGAVVWASTETVEGIKCSLIGCSGKMVTGLQFSLVNLAEKVAGLQLGIYNQAKNETFQIGLLNHIENGCLPWMPVLNFKF